MKEWGNEKRLSFFLIEYKVWISSVGWRTLILESIFFPFEPEDRHFTFFWIIRSILFWFSWLSLIFRAISLSSMSYLYRSMVLCRRQPLSRTLLLHSQYLSSCEPTVVIGHESDPKNYLFENFVKVKSNFEVKVKIRGFPTSKFGKRTQTPWSPFFFFAFLTRRSRITNSKLDSPEWELFGRIFTTDSESLWVIHQESVNHHIFLPLFLCSLRKHTSVFPPLFPTLPPQSDTPSSNHARLQ